LNDFWGAETDPTAQGRIQGARPVAVLDIGSNSVRLVVYERHARALTPLYNEKSACALGRGLAQTGRIADANIERALTAMQRFALVARLMRVGTVHVLATSAVREAKNSQSFVSAIEQVMGADVRVLSGEEEAHFAALGVVAGIPAFEGVVGDQGGGSLELTALAKGRDAVGETHELGVIRLQDDSGGGAHPPQAIAGAEGEAERGVLRHRRHLAVLCQDPAGPVKLSPPHGAALRRAGRRGGQALRRHHRRRRCRPADAGWR
jgi:exopolyphosphatase/guanosine-5'-triphosphate,3'-diphosphate pyrophosphatase